VRINEVFADPLAGGPGGRGEWVELVNRGTSELDLTGWTLGDLADPADLLLPLSPGGGMRIAPGGFALVLDPDTPIPSELEGQDGVLLLRPEDGSIGNGLRGELDLLLLVDAGGRQLDRVEWSTSAGKGRSWERVDPPLDAGASWRPSRHPSGATPGVTNSWTPVPGDRRVRLRPITAGLRAGDPVTVQAVVSDDGGAGLTGLHLIALITGPDRDEYSLGEIPVPSVAVWDSSVVEWRWTPRNGGWPLLRVHITRPPRARSWADADSAQPAVAWPKRTRVVSEAMTRPMAGGPEWLELWDRRADGDGSVAAPGAGTDWQGWRLWVAGSGPSTGGARSRLLGPGGSQVLLVAADLPVPRADPAASTVHWPGLRLSDAGSRVVLFDPTGAVVDSVVLRPTSGLPRGHTLHRLDPDLAGWSPAAWRIGLTLFDSDPGVPPEPPPDRAGEGSEMKFRWTHEDGEIRFSWVAPADRLWLEARIYDMEGRLVAVPIPPSLQPGVWSIAWGREGREGHLRPGLHLLVVEAVDATSSRRWRLRRALGIRP